jgi:GNAT superfamily N-acetyltransferase
VLTHVEPGPVDDQLKAELLRLWVEASNAGGAIGFTGMVGPEDVQPRLDEALAAVAEGRELLSLLRYDGQLAACGYLELNEWDLARHWAWVMRVMVAPALQRRGLGRLLLDGLTERARDRGLEMLRLEVRGGLGLEEFYAQAGYVEVARIAGILRVAPDDDRDEVTMIKHLT